MLCAADGTTGIVRTSSPVPPTSNANIVQLYSQYDFDALQRKYEDDLHLIRQGYENELLVLLDDNNKLVETIRNNHLYKLSVVKSTHANELRLIKSTHANKLRLIKSTHAKELRVIKSTHAKELRVINLTHADELRTLRTAQREQRGERHNILWSVFWNQKGHSRYRNSITFLDGFLVVEVVLIASTVMFILWVCLYQRPFVTFMANRIECKWSGCCL